MTRDEFIARRKALGMTRHQLAEALGVGYRTIQDWELGNRAGVLVNTRLVELALAALECQIEKR